MANADQSRIVRFGLFEVDLRAAELRKNGVKIKLQEQPFRVLVALLRNAGDVVTREELRRELWPTDTFVDFDHSLNAAVKRLRDALDDSAENPRFIETLPRHGYRFIASRAPETIQSRSAASPLRHWVLPLVAAALLIVSVLFVLDVGGLRRKALFRAASQPQIRSLAVLPLTNISADPQQEYFADGMTDELIGELSRIGSLRVISRTSVMQYKGERKKSLPQIGRELNVDAVIEGSVLRAGNRVRIATHMIYSPTDQSVMAERYEGDLGDVLKIQREVAESVAKKIRLKLTPEEQSRLHQAPTVDPEAYQTYLAATHIDLSGYQGIPTIPSFAAVKKSQSYLETAIEKDPSLASAYTGLAVSYVFLAAQRWQSPREAFPLAKQAVQKALALDAKNCEANALLARISWEYDWDWQTADKVYLRGLELCPNDSRFHLEYAIYRAVNGRIAEARVEVAKARELDAIRSEPFISEAVISYHSRNYKALVETAQAFAAENPNDWLAHYWLGVGFEGSGQTVRAIPAYQKAVELSQGDSDPTAQLAHAYGAIGRKAEARNILQGGLRQSVTGYMSPYMIATVHASLGETDQAFEYLEKAYEERSPDLAYFLRADLRMDHLRSDRRFQDLLRRMNFPA
jgi:TolB-like protein/DNA-binding winged helix-turn-helix (wHTH) protein/Flp pilus assembly protein TadD